MGEFVLEGKVRSLGVSNFNKHHLYDLLEYAKIRPEINQIKVHPLMTLEENISFNRSLNIQVQAWRPFGQVDIVVVGLTLLQQLAAKYGKPSSQIELQCIMQLGFITIPRCKPNHFKEILELATFELSYDDMKAISALNKNLRSNVNNDSETFPW